MSRKVLIADDEQSIRKLYERELTREGYEVVLASNGKETLEKVRDSLPDLVVLDIRMPGMDGLHVMSKLLEENNELPVVINSAYASYKDSFMSWAADAYLVKSSDLTELKKTINEVLESRSVCS